MTPNYGWRCTNTHPSDYSVWIIEKLFKWTVMLAALSLLGFIDVLVVKVPDLTLYMTSCQWNYRMYYYNGIIYSR